MNGAWGVLRNYHAHAKEMGSHAPTSPTFFLMPQSAICLADESGKVVMNLGGGVRNEPPNRIEHEVELVVRIGSNLLPDAMAVGCDTTDRTLQAAAKSEGKPWLAAKGFDGAAVVGTWAPFNDGDFAISLSVNGEIRQQGKTSEMVHDIETLTAALADDFTLASGDLIFTGTPSGVASLEVGDLVDASLKDETGQTLSHFSATCIGNES